MTIQPFDSIEPFYEAAADAFCEWVRQRSDAADRVNVSLSGGSTPRRLYEMLADRDLDWQKVHWFWGDERNVPADHDDSNYNMVNRALLNPINAPPSNVHRVPVDSGDPPAVAAEYEDLLRRHFAGQEFPRWDLVLLGMGDDAHTASLFPHTGALQQQERWFVENWVEKFAAYRYTLTAPAINSANQIWFLIAGAGKKEALTNVLSDPPNPELYPSQKITPTRWFITQDAMPG